MTTFTPIEIPDVPPVQFPWENPPPEPPQEPVKVLPVIVHGATYVWDDVYKWASSAFDSLLGNTANAVSLSTQDYVNIAKMAMSISQTITANFVAMLENWVNDGIAHLTTALVGLGEYTLTELLKVYQELIDLSATLVGLIQQQIAMVENDITTVEHNLTNIIQMTTDNIVNWVRTDIALPIMQALQELDLKTQMEMQSILSQAETYADDALNAKLAPLLLTIAAMQGQIRKLLTESDECTQPMCDTMGPKTDLGKWLKALEGLFGLLAGFELAGLTEEQLAHFAQVFASISGQDLQSLLVGFTEQGATIGQAAAGVLGDITDVGTVVLHDLGIPVP